LRIVDKIGPNICKQNLRAVKVRIVGCDKRPRERHRLAEGRVRCDSSHGVYPRLARQHVITTINDNRSVGKGYGSVCVYLLIPLIGIVKGINRRCDVSKE
jgi:hypothetical protein